MLAHSTTFVVGRQMIGPPRMLRRSRPKLANAYAVNMTLFKALIALAPAGMLFPGSLILFFGKQGSARSCSESVLRVSSWSLSLISSKRFTCFARWGGEVNTALAITSIWRALFSASRSFPRGICFTPFRADLSKHDRRHWDAPMLFIRKLHRPAARQPTEHTGPAGISRR
jgi:hypothetical protein